MIASSSPRVSIGLPVYNGEAFLGQALDSLLAQSYPDFELIISDNASTDHTQEICLDYASREARITYLRNPENLGAATNYNLLVRAARGEYFKWQAADDVCAPQFLQRCIEVLDQDGETVLCYPMTTIIDENNSPVELYPDDLHLSSPSASRRYAQFHKRFRTLEKCNSIFGLIRMDALRKTRLIGSFRASDMILLAELTLLGKFYELPEYMFFRRDHPQTSMRAYSKAERVAWFDPKLRDKYQNFYWTILTEYFRSIHTIPSGLSAAEKLRCDWEVIRWGIWRRMYLGNELLGSAARRAHRLPKPIKTPLSWTWNRLLAVGKSLRRRSATPPTK
jgi:glycosyltransferase involved in cell wall biosynthesis